MPGVVLLVSCGGGGGGNGGAPSSPRSVDADGDGVADTLDRDDDGDGLIELRTAEELYNVRYVLDGTGYRDSASAVNNSMGCGGRSGITTCAGYELLNNISLANYGGGVGWLPIGHDTASDDSGCQGGAFSGVFDGDGYAVVDLTINRPAEDCIGLFGQATGEIRNLTVQGDNIIDRNRAGGLVGDGVRSSITSSYAVVGAVTGTGAVGGLVGSGGDATITSSYAVVGAVTGTGAVGGLVGSGGDATITSSYAVVGAVTGSSSVGGLVGGLLVRVLPSPPPMWWLVP